MKKKVLISGGSRGIGRATALFLEKNDFEVLAPSSKELNLRSNFSIDEFFKNNFSAKDPLYALISNAGVFHSSSLEKYRDEDFEKLMEINLFGAFRLCRKALNFLKNSPESKIVFISSVSGLAGEAYASAYSASKAGLIGMAKSLALELATENIQVNAICPGWVKTDMSLSQLNSEEKIKNHLEASLQNRWIEADEIASLINFLLSEKAKAITGQTINISAGLF